VGAQWKALGRGEPVTAVVPGLAATEGEARIPAAGLPGTRAVLTLPGHGRAPDPEPEYWDYRNIAADVLAVADEVGATRAIGVSLGAGALTRLAAQQPNRFDRLVLMLPAVLDEPRESSSATALQQLSQAVEAGDEERLRQLVAADLPAGARLGDYVEQRTAALLRLAPALRRLPAQRVVEDAGVLAEVASEVLVIGAVDDPLHPAEVAKQVAAAFRSAHLEVLPSKAPLITHRREVRQLLVDFLA
jgi:3-oxoadipate enol-lactonase